MSRTAAFFDLDRTLLAGASGPVFAEAFSELGVPTPNIPGQDLLFRFFDLVGESYLVMQLAKRASSRTKGLRRSDVARVAEWAADVLLPKVQPYAPALLRSHRESGDLLVLATTSPFDLVSPLARRLGFDAVVATRYGELEGMYTGELDGGFVWGPGKLAAVKTWAAENNVDLDASAAYSDSVFDAPLLGAVGRPTAVNPDYRLRALAAVRRWPIRSLDTPVGVPSVSGIEPYDIVRTFTRPEFFPGVAFRFSGTEHIPHHGPAILAVNHRSYFDPLAISLAAARAGRNPRFLGKKEVFDAPVLGQIATLMGGIRVDRGTGSDAPLKAAADGLEAGEVIVILPEGTIPRGEAFFDPILRGRTGVARLAAMCPEVPVIPIGLWGTEKVWPRSSKVPKLLTITDPPEVVVTVGPPVTGLQLTDTSAQVDTDAIMAAIMDLLPPESRIERVVSADELARTMPGGTVAVTSKPRPAAGTRPPKKSAVTAAADAHSATLTTSIAATGLRVSERAKPPKKAKKTKPPKSAQPTKPAASGRAPTAVPTAAPKATRTPPSRRVPGTLADR